jgi:uncharacterized protein (TIGR02453 family)
MTFTGFAKAAPGFFHQLAVEMNRDWFAAHKADYEALWVAPMTALLADVAAGLARSYPRPKLGAPKLFRIYRDVRFGKDKSPYKTHIAGVIPTTDKKATESAAALYLQLGLDEEMAAAGHYVFDDAALARWRKVVAAPRGGAKIAALISSLRDAGYGVTGHAPLQRVPKGFAPDHPRAELLKLRGLVVTFPAIPRGMIHQAKLTTWLVEHGRAAAPLVRWLATNLG